MPETTDYTKNRFTESVKFLPVAFVTSIICGLWFVYTYYHCTPRPETEERWKDISDEYALWENRVFNTVTIMLLICYVKCILVHPGTIPEKEEDLRWDMAKEDQVQATVAELAAVGLATERKKTGDRRSCKWCSKYKPDRCHHCRVCRVCVLKMDHHCPWIYNCVGFRNHKYFLLLLFYSAIACQYIMWTMCDSLRAVLNNPNSPFMSMFLLLFGQTLAIFLGLLVTVFFLFHVWLMLKAMTTIELCEKWMKKLNYDGSAYDRGSYANVKAVLGDNVWLWLLPLSPPSGDGLTYTSEDSFLLLHSDTEAGLSRQEYYSPRPAQSPTFPDAKEAVEEVDSRRQSESVIQAEADVAVAACAAAAAAANAAAVAVADAAAASSSTEAKPLPKVASGSGESQAVSKRRSKPSKGPGTGGVPELSASGSEEDTDEVSAEVDDDEEEASSASARGRQRDSHQRHEALVSFVHGAAAQEPPAPVLQDVQQASDESNEIDGAQAAPDVTRAAPSEEAQVHF